MEIVSTTAAAPTEISTLTMSWYAVNVILVVGLNILVLAILHYQKELQDVMRYLYRTLASFNLILGISWNTWSLFWFSDSDRDTCVETTRFFLFITRVLMISVLVCLCGISLNMYLLISRPLRYNGIMTKKTFLVVLAVHFSVVLCICVIFLPVAPMPFVNIWIMRCLNEDLSPKEERLYMTGAMVVVVPALITILFKAIVNIILLRNACKHMRSVAGREHPVSRRNIEVTETRPKGNDHSHAVNGDRNRAWPGRDLHKQAPLYKRSRGAITVFLLTGSVVVGWLPFVIYQCIQSTKSIQIVDLLGTSSMWVQPLAYLLTNGEAKRLCKNILHRTWVFCHRTCQSSF